MIQNQQPVYVFRITPTISTTWSLLSLVLLIALIIAVGEFYGAIHKQSLTLVLEGQEEWRRGLLVLLGVMGVTFGTIIIHELIHGIAFSVFGGSPRYGAKIKHFLPLFYTTCPHDHFSRNAFLVIALAPLVVINGTSLMLLAIFSRATWLSWVIALNTAGAIGDLWVTGLLLRFPHQVSVEDRKEGVAIYAPPSLDANQLPRLTSSDSRSGLGRSQSRLGQWLRLFILATVLFGFGLPLLLPPILVALQVQSFTVGTDAFWILIWQNDSNRIALSINFLVLALIAALISLFSICNSKR